MLFNSLHFPIFLTIVLFLFKAIPPKWRKTLLLIASYIFYGYWNYKFLSLLFLSTLIDYYSAIKIESSNRKFKKYYLALSIVSNLGILSVFKYYNFFTSEFSVLLFQLTGISVSQYKLDIVLPMGISFYTFQSMSYTIDVYRGILNATKSIVDFSLYVSFFPQLVAGPIEKAKNLLPQLKELKFGSKSDFYVAVHLIAFGYLKKVIIGDQLSFLVDSIFDNYQSLSSLELLEGVIAFSLQIYFDFSGYSDLARGLGRIFGIHLMVNFKQPYLSTSITEFWHRWHISLSEWLKEYLYFSLGGNRRGKIKTYRNLLLTMLLGGLWHGANMTFVVWGFIHGIGLVIHKFFFQKQTNLIEIKKNYLYSFISILGTYILVLISWVFFRSPNCSAAFEYISRIVILKGNFSLPSFISIIAMVIGLFSFDFICAKSKYETPLMHLPKISQIIIIFIIIVVTFLLIATDTRDIPFIYFQF